MAVREASQDCAGGIKVMDAHTSRVHGSSHRGGTEMYRSTAGTVSAASSVWVRSKHPATSQALSVCLADVCCSFLLWFLKWLEVHAYSKVSSEAYSLAN